MPKFRVDATVCKSFSIKSYWVSGNTIISPMSRNQPSNIFRDAQKDLIRRPIWNCSSSSAFKQKQYKSSPHHCSPSQVYLSLQDEYSIFILSHTHLLSIYVRDCHCRLFYEICLFGPSIPTLQHCWCRGIICFFFAIREKQSFSVYTWQATQEVIAGILNWHKDSIRLGGHQRRKDFHWGPLMVMNSPHTSPLWNKLSKIIASMPNASTTLMILGWALIGTRGRIRENYIICTSQSSVTQTLIASFKNASLVTMLATSFGNGDTFPPLFVIQGRSIQYKTVRNPDKNQVDVETLFDWFPIVLFAVPLDDAAGTDRQKLYDRAKKFCEWMKGKPSINRKFLLVYEGYKSHIDPKALHNFGLLFWHRSILHPCSYEWEASAIRFWHFWPL